MKTLWRRSFSISYGDMRLAAAAYMLLPAALFFIGFLRWYYALIGLFAIGVAYYGFIKTRKSNSRCKHTLELKVSTMVGLFFLMLLWCQLGGLNGYLYQSADFDCRNAIFRDLITHRWPVVYESSNSALVYYVGHWLPAALIGKLTNLLFHNARFTWFAGRMALWAWTALGLTAIAMLLMLYTNADSFKKKLAVLCVFIFFSGMDIIGTFLYGEQAELFSPDVLHLEWWPPHGYQYTSVTACLYWVFNQSVVPWMATACFLMDKDERNYLAYGVGCLVCGPLPLVGLAAMMILSAVCRLISQIFKRRAGTWFKAVFSWSNILLLIIALPALAMYLFGNNSISATSQSAFVEEGSSFFSRDYWNKDLLIFYVLEVGVYLALVWNAHKKDPLIYIVAISLLVIPYIHVGTSTDFCMRASIPGVFVVLSYVADYLVHYFPVRNRPKGRAKSAAVVLLIAVLCGAATPCVEIYRGIYHVVQEKTYRLANDRIITFDDGSVSTNFSTADADKKFFFKHLAR